jgi:pimeloyl-ACP methyl ester carboxylesterase
MLFILAPQFSGCASLAQQLDARANGLGYRKIVLPGAGFRHVAYIKAGHRAGNKILHVYLEGDGTPWIRKRVPASDPTPRNPLMLDLMALDPAPGVYLGRPCYNGMHDKACSSDLWTDKRYSETVVASMSAALDRVSAEYETLVLLGYSGGGTLAMLLAERQPKVRSVVTVAANLDTDRWAALHRQLALSGSMNPAARPPLRPSIRQMHYAGEEDENVPPRLVREAISRQQGAEFSALAHQDHACCWRDVWPMVLGGLAEYQY